MPEARPSVLVSEPDEIAFLVGEPAWESVAEMVREVGLTLRLARERRGLTQPQVAESVGLSTSVLCRLELARRPARLTTVWAACNALGVRFSDVLRTVEELTFPAGDGPWTQLPALLIECVLPSDDVAVDVPRRGLVTTQRD